MKFTNFLSRFLNTDELNKVAYADKILRKYYLGTYPADIKPKHLKKCCWIWNTDESDKSGQHWVACFKNGKKVFFFDSFANNVEFYNRHYWEDILKEFVYEKHQQLQSYISTTCGVWCLVYLR